MKTFHHSTKTRERVSAASNARKPLTGRALRRRESRDEAKAMASLASHDPRAVKFHF